MNYIKEILVNLVRSTLMTKFADLDQAEKRRISFEKNRKAKDLPHMVTFFYQLDDPYSMLSAQFLKKLVIHFNVKLDILSSNTTILLDVCTLVDVKAFDTIVVEVATAG